MLLISSFELVFLVHIDLLMSLSTAVFIINIVVGVVIRVAMCISFIFIPISFSFCNFLAMFVCFADLIIMEVVVFDKIRVGIIIEDQVVYRYVDPNDLKLVDISPYRRRDGSYVFFADSLMPFQIIFSYMMFFHILSDDSVEDLLAKHGIFDTVNFRTSMVLELLYYADSLGLDRLFSITVRFLFWRGVTAREANEIIGLSGKFHCLNRARQLIYKLMNNPYRASDVEFLKPDAPPWLPFASVQSMFAFDNVAQDSQVSTKMILDFKCCM